MRHLHALTPGDHYSPRTGSAVATVVHGLAEHTAPRPGVLLAEGTYPDRYGSADPVEYRLSHHPHGVRRSTRAIDALLGRAALPRPWARQVYRQVVLDQDSWDPAYVIAHNAPQLVPLVSDRHAPVLYVHNNLLTWYGPQEANRVLGAAHRLICVSSYTAEQMSHKLHPSLRSRLRVVPNGVEAQQFAIPRVPRDEALRVGYVGRVVPSKGVHVLLKAVATLGRPDIAVTVVGSSGFAADDHLTPYEAKLREIAGRVPGGVEFVPFQPRWDLPSLYARFDVTVVPSTAPEAFALTVLEGMASGTAVVASELGGIPEAAGDGAHLVKPGDVTALAEAIEAFADSPGLLASCAERGRVRADTLSWKRSAAHLVDALD